MCPGWGAAFGAGAFPAGGRNREGLTSSRMTEATDTMAEIGQQQLVDLVACRSKKLLSLGACLVDPGPCETVVTRPFLGQLISQSMQVKELLDAYGAQHNRRWRPVRSRLATLANFAEVGYELLHVLHVLPTYRLRPIAEDFAGDTRRALAFVGDVLGKAASLLLEEGRQLGLAEAEPDPSALGFDENLPPGRLPKDLETRKAETVGQIVTRLATALLNLAAESEPLHVVGRTKREEFASLVPESVSEDKLRFLQHRFHNLQSLYDTYVSETETEVQDPDLPVLRGHVSIVFHLMKMATALSHYYERHLDGCNGGRRCCEGGPVGPEELLDHLVGYCLGYANRYLECGRRLSQAMLARYAQRGSVDVPVPRYRGFHVRPSTLVAKIVLHYGSEVRLEMSGHSFDAGSPMEIFRVNEKINAEKRHWLAEVVADRKDVHHCPEGVDIGELAQRIVIELAGEGKMVIYEQPLEIPSRLAEADQTLLEQILDELARLQATGKIDIPAELTVTFRGDRRVLEDIRRLAECGYGEDNFGNNIALPRELRYLRR